MNAFPFLLILRLSHKDREFLESIYIEYANEMRRIAGRFCLRTEDVDDLISDVLVRLSQHLDTLQSLSPEAKRYYIAKTIRNTAINRGKHTKWLAEHEAGSDPSIMEQVQAKESVEESVLFHAEVALIQELMKNLTPKELHALRMKKMTGAEDWEIARALDLSESSVAQYVRRAQKKLWALYKEVKNNESSMD